ncbi:MAG: DNA translocase FtsK 4TM domain-containing protein [Gammaproteobacteria bacterium]|nr:DNA translocase FtsK 4TM domain-containing protein [Gammaproteobacteria bacterium]
MRSTAGIAASNAAAQNEERSSRALPLREFLLILLAGLAVYVFLALVSYAPRDPGFTHAGTDLPVSNVMGMSGAYTADGALLAMGWMAYLLPLGCVAGAYGLMRRPAPVSIVWLRVAGFLAAALASCALLDLAAPGSASALPAGAGGALGEQLVAAALPALDRGGVALVALAGFAIGMQAMLGFSWAWLVECVGRGVWGTCAWLVGLVSRVAARRRPEPHAAGGSMARELEAPPVEAPARRTRAKREGRERRTPPELKPRAAKQPTLFDATDPQRMPRLDLLDMADDGPAGFSREARDRMSDLLVRKLKDFRVEASVKDVLPGPVVTRFELDLAPGVKVSRITGLAKDLARSLAVTSVRIVEVIPGKSLIGIEVPNADREMVRLRDVLDSPKFTGAAAPLTLALGKDIAGEPMMADIARMPHLLVAGTTGSGKSVGINAMLVSMLYKCRPEDLRLILVDPKMLELAVYEGIPHLLTPVVTDMKDAAAALNWCVGEMERRYRLMAGLGVRNLAGFNGRIIEARQAGETVPDPTLPAEDAANAPELEPLPLIVVVIDEFADMMMIVGKKVDQLIARIAQKARAAGIHLILATQRPSVDVITGLIKANIPARIGFQVSSKIDSRTILDQGGAEQLLGYGDMLFLPPGTSVPTRVHGAFVSDDEVHRVVADWKRRGRPEYLDDVLAGGVPDFDGGGVVAAVPDDVENSDALYDEAVAFVLESRRASISSVQRKFRIGYNRSARLIEAMEQAGVVSAMNSNGGREVLVPARD